MQPLADLLDYQVKTRVRSVHDLASSADTAARVVDDIGDATVLAGWSLGGMIALSTATQYPRSVRALILIGTPAKFCSAPDYRHGFPGELLKRLATQLKTDTEAALRGFFQRSAVPQTPGDDDLKCRIEYAMRIGIAPLLEGIAYLEDTDLRSEVSKLECPLLIIHGRKDAVVPWRAGNMLAQQIPNSHWELHPEAGHDLPLQSPALVSDRILEFVRSLNGCQ